MTKICVWRTGHEIADTVFDAVLEGLRSPMGCYTQNHDMPKLIGCADIHIGYGILRGMVDVFRECDKQGKPWFNIDRGYWKPGHYDGYYRVSLRGTQQTSGWPKPDWGRWERLGLTVEPMVSRPPPAHTLACPVTDYAGDFFKGYKAPWPDRKWADAGHKALLREKGCARSLDDDLNGASNVVTFNSSVGWEALRRGIPVESDPVHSIVGAWQAKCGTDKRLEMMATMAALQLTLAEMRNGKLRPLMERLLSA